MVTELASNVEETLRQIEDRYQAERRAVLDGLPQTSSSASKNLRPMSPPATVRIGPRGRRKSSKAESEIERPSLLDDPTTLNTVLTGDSTESETEPELYVETPLPPRIFDFEDLRKHIKDYEFTVAGQALLEDVVVEHTLDDPGLFHEYSQEDVKQHHAHYSVFDVGTDGAPIRRMAPCQEDKVDDDTEVWQILQTLNMDPDRQTAVGRISLIREPSPIILGALHLTMNKDFDMDEIFGYLLEDNNSAAHMHHRNFDHDERHQRSFIFKFDYFTVVGKDLIPMPWQKTDDTEKMKKRLDKHFQISRCTSVVALSLSGKAVSKLRNVARRAKKQEGLIFDTWAPWHVLNIQCYPDHEHTMDSHDSTMHYVNGPEAFLHTLLAEFKDAEKRFKIILKKVTELVVPPSHFMFDGLLRDKLLFEDEDYTYSRRYFWAFQTLALMGNGIKAILEEYKHTFTDEVWEGKHKTLWPVGEEGTHRTKYWRHRLAHLKRDFEIEIGNLHNIFDENEARKEEIASLANQLFQGTSVVESRKSVDLAAVTILQGHNIKLLTLVSIFFLPLTFVTSIFGMTNIPSEHWSRAFGITMATVCVPFFFLIGSLNTNKGMEFWRKKWMEMFAWVRGVREHTLEADKIALGNPRTFRRSRTISLTAGRPQTRKAEYNDDKSAPAFDTLRVFTPARLGQVDQLSVDITTDERRLSGQSFSKARMPSITTVPLAEEGTVEEIQMERSSSLWGRISNHRRSGVGHPDNV